MKVTLFGGPADGATVDLSPDPDPTENVVIYFKDDKTKPYTLEPGDSVMRFQG